MGAGDRNTRVIIEYRAEVNGAYGKQPGTWVTYISRWAKVVTLSASESTDADKEAVTKRYRLELLYDTQAAAITEDMRVNMRGVILEIDGVLNINQGNKEVHLFCHG